MADKGWEPWATAAVDFALQVLPLLLAAFGRERESEAFQELARLYEKYGPSDAGGARGEIRNIQSRQKEIARNRRERDIELEKLRKKGEPTQEGGQGEG